MCVKKKKKTNNNNKSLKRKKREIKTNQKRNKKPLNPSSQSYF
jgi:hypothetical protein